MLQCESLINLVFHHNTFRFIFLLLLLPNQGGGIFLGLFTEKYFAKKYCIGELKIFRHLKKVRLSVWNFYCLKRILIHAYIHTYIYIYISMYRLYQWYRIRLFEMQYILDSFASIPFWKSWFINPFRFPLILYKDTLLISNQVAVSKYSIGWALICKFNFLFLLILFLSELDVLNYWCVQFSLFGDHIPFFPTLVWLRMLLINTIKVFSAVLMNLRELKRSYPTNRLLMIHMFPTYWELS